MAMKQSFYDVLGVDPAAPAPAVRKAYLVLARKYHPDFHQAATRELAADNMRRVNEAWNTLSDPDRRKAYDQKLLFGTAPDSSGGSHTGGTSATSREWEPFDTSEPEDIDLDPTPQSGSRSLPRWLTMLPAGSLISAVVVAGVGTLLQSGGMFTIGLMLGVFALASFFLVPLAAMTLAERDPRL